MERDCIKYFRKYHKWLVYSDKINAPPTPLFNLTSLWPFAIWRIDVIRFVNPKANNGHRFTSTTSQNRWKLVHMLMSPRR
jgi:hypothetical protein